MGVVYRPQGQHAPKVTLLSGGGGGHEPGHTGYVANGMLDAAVSGPIFASPNAKFVRAGLRHIASPKGSLVVIKNYTGDRLNFGLAAEQARAYDGQELETVVVQDDVAVPRSRCGLVGRRGLAGVVLVHKVAGASAAEGAALAEVAANSRYVADRLATIGVSLEACSVPGLQEGRTIAPGEMELGMGIHNEPGSQRISSEQDIMSLVGSMLSAILDQSNKERGFLNWNNNTQFVLLVNNLGGLSKLELLAITDHVLHGSKTNFGMSPSRVYSGTYLSSLDGRGFSITLLALEQAHSADVFRLLDAPTSCVNWQVALPFNQHSTAVRPDSPLKEAPPMDIDTTPLKQTIQCDANFFNAVIQSIFSSLEREEPAITRFDTYLGDGDCGTTLLAGAAGLKQTFSDLATANMFDLLTSTQRLTDSLGTTMGGTSGALYSIFFSGFGGGLQQAAGNNPNVSLSLDLISDALMQGLATMRKYTSAGVGDRTMMDALIPFVQSLHMGADQDAVAALNEAVDAARKGCESTTRLQSKYGRSTYVGAAQEAGENEADAIPDPGACGVVAIVQGILDAMIAQRVAY
ncbi:Dihydroxyacetone kinase 2 [Didymosphaeria variabile]|uniref:Dihydroxyacetone kinase 2 n=1 Tax=Didymosphaeria variabile TaxID=1932322 RepID=A0A9W8XBT2_9PLEO|nr:Dihydroxyacetone kinase 2 [Didymosphaeria variabile]KAJ4346755.1 Dihydroxyacetone kinase 2 [Didymosphaeria variabile]